MKNTKAERAELKEGNRRIKRSTKASGKISLKRKKSLGYKPPHPNLGWLKKGK